MCESVHPSIAQGLRGVLAPNF